VMKKPVAIWLVFLMMVLNALLVVSCTPEIVLCRVGFNSLGGSVIPSVGVLAGRHVDEPVPPTRFGYVFDTWYTDKGCTTAWDFWGETVSEDLTLYAGWIAAYTVSFDSKEGSSVGAVDIADGSLLREPARPSRAGYVFDGWYRDISRENRWDFATTAVESDITLYAKWIAFHTVSFNTMGGRGVSDIEDVVDGSVISAPIAPQRPGFGFLGWYKENTLENLWDFDLDTVTQDVTLYAKWRDYAVKDIGPSGGYIFYDKGSVTDGWRYLEAAPASTEWTDKVWGGAETVVGETEFTIGTGESNTGRIVAVLGDAEPYEAFTDYAAKVCTDLVVTNDGVEYDDWFLPSLNELVEIYNVLIDNGLGGFAVGSYWSSTEFNALLSYQMEIFDEGDIHPSSSSKYHYHQRTRAVRAF
jgi:uncharacterized repeat protein (TIGR02543 family)